MEMGETVGRLEGSVFRGKETLGARVKRIRSSEDRVRTLVVYMAQGCSIAAVSKTLNVHESSVKKRIRVSTPEEKNRAERIWLQSTADGEVRLCQDARAQYYDLFKAVKDRLRAIILDKETKPYDVAKNVEALAKVYDTLHRYPIPAEHGFVPTLMDIREASRMAVWHGAHQQNTDCIKMGLELADGDYDPRRTGKDDGSVAPDLARQAEEMDNEKLREATFRIIKGGAEPEASPSPAAAG